VNVIHELTTESTIRRAARERWHVFAAMVTRYRPHPFRGGNGDDGGLWYILSIQQKADSEWEIICRRRTLGELLEVVESRSEPMPNLVAPKSLGGTSRESTRPVGANPGANGGCHTGKT
jgi:hypothetical protein